MALIATTIGVVVVGAPIVRDWLVPTRSTLDGTIADAPLEGLSVLITNRGKTAGVFNSLQIAVRRGDAEAVGIFRPRVEQATKTVAVAGMSSELVSMEAFLPNHFVWAGVKETCSAKYFFTNDDGSVTTTEHSFNCGEMDCGMGFPVNSIKKRNAP
jgi:hypothetical protein